MVVVTAGPMGRVGQGEGNVLERPDALGRPFPPRSLRSAVRVRPASTSIRIPGFEVHAGSHAAGSSLPAHAHDDPTLCYVIAGRFTEYARGRALDCEADTLKLTAAGETHSDRFPHVASRGLRIDIARERFGGSPAIARLLDGEFVMPRSRVRPLVQRLVAELDTPDEAAPLVIEGLLLELLARLARERSRVGARDLPAWLRRADEVVRERFTTALTLSGVAAEVGVNASTLARAYRARFGLSVGAQVRQLRIEWAADALRTSEERTSIIALRAGFYDQAHFTNVFRAAMGVSPSQYRRLAR
jgi:AraC family transcriptional regulator